MRCECGWTLAFVCSRRCALAYLPTIFNPKCVEHDADDAVRDGKWTRLLHALDAGERCAAPAADQCTRTAASTSRVPHILYSLFSSSPTVNVSLLLNKLRLIDSDHSTTRDVTTPSV